MKISTTLIRTGAALSLLAAAGAAQAAPPTEITMDPGEMRMERTVAPRLGVAHPLPVSGSPPATQSSEDNFAGRLAFAIILVGGPVAAALMLRAGHQRGKQPILESAPGVSPTARLAQQLIEEHDGVEEPRRILLEFPSVKGRTLI